MNITFKEVMEAWFEKHNVTIYILDVRRNSFAISNGKVQIQQSVIIDNNSIVGKLENIQERSNFDVFERT